MVFFPNCPTSNGESFHSFVGLRDGKLLDLQGAEVSRSLRFGFSVRFLRNAPARTSQLVSTCPLTPTCTAALGNALEHVRYMQRWICPPTCPLPACTYGWFFYLQPPLCSSGASVFFCRPCGTEHSPQDLDRQSKTNRHFLHLLGS